MASVLIVAATKYDKMYFERSMYLGQALKRLSYDKTIESSIIYDSRVGLPALYNAHLVEAHRDKIVLFTHADVYIDDYFLSVHLNEAIRKFDVVGLAGNKRRVPRQPSWAFVTDYPQFQWDRPENLSGAVCHFGDQGSVVSAYGTFPAGCQLLDGVFLAARVGALIDHKVRFDERFPFEFYDMDFCRTATNAGLKLGTWPIAITHASGGSFGSPEWRRCKDLYLQKWPD
jgi:GT2 family glycosyltransferase